MNLSSRNIYQVKKCGNYGNSLSHFFDKNFVKVTFLLKKMLKSWFDEIFYAEAAEAIYHLTHQNNHFYRLKNDQSWFNVKSVRQKNNFFHEKYVISFNTDGKFVKWGSSGSAYYSNTHLFSNFCSKNVTFTKFLPKMCPGSFNFTWFWAKRFLFVLTFSLCKGHQWLFKFCHIMTT